jgi:hypothetical protein
MSKYFTLLLICNVLIIYGQNPLAVQQTFEDQVKQANRDYETLTSDEKVVCDLAHKNWVIQCASKLIGMKMNDLVPTEINPTENLNDIDQSLKDAIRKARLSTERVQEMNIMSYYRWSGLWKAKADSVGKKCACWPLYLETTPSTRR